MTHTKADRAALREEAETLLSAYDAMSMHTQDMRGIQHISVPVPLFRDLLTALGEIEQERETLQKKLLAWELELAQSLQWWGVYDWRAMIEKVKKLRAAEATLHALQEQRTGHVDIVFNGPPDHHSPSFIEVEDEQARSIRLGGWLQREDGNWVLRIPRAPSEPRNGCPCLYTTPCDAQCSCVVPVSSRGCTRCCRYGSPAQQRTMAEQLAEPRTVDPALIAKLRDRLLGLQGNINSRTEESLIGILGELLAVLTGSVQKEKA